MRQALRRTYFVFALAFLSSVLIASAAEAGPYTRLQVLLPGETAAPGTSSGKTGTALQQVSGFPFNITVRACDSGWNTVATISNSISIDATDASATVPSPAQLSSGTRTFSITLNAAGTFTVFAHDETDNTIPDGSSAAVTVRILDHFIFSNISQKNQNAGTPMPITVTAKDPAGNTVTGYTGPVQLKELTSFGDGRISPASVALSSGAWSGNVTMYRADETSINRGNVNVYAYDATQPSKNGTSDPFTVHPGVFSRVQIIVPGESPLPGSVSGVTGTPATQSSGTSFNVSVYATDPYWNPVASGDNVRVTSSDGATNQSGLLTNGFRQFTVHLNTVGTQTLSVTDLTSGSKTPMTSAGIQVIPTGVDHFVINTITGPVTAGVPITVTIRATDAGGNTVPGYNADAIIQANTGNQSITPTSVTFTNGTWTGQVTFKGAGGAVALTCADYSAPPKVGTSNSFVVTPGPFTGLQVLLPGETALGGTPAGKTGVPTTQTAGTQFTTTVRAVDQFWNLVPGVSDRIVLASTDAFAWMPSDTVLVNGQVLIPTRLHKSGDQVIWARDSTTTAITPDTSSAVTVTGGTFQRVLILAPGEIVAPGTTTGRAGTATDQSINYGFTVTALATDQWWNPVGGVSDVVHVTSGDPLATLPPDQAMVNGRADLTIRLATGGFQQITVADVTNPAKTGASTQVRAISSGFHLEATVSPSTARAGEPFTLAVRVTNDAGSVIQEINSFITVEVQNAGTQSAGRGTLLTTQFQLLQGQRAVSETYTFAEPIVMVVRDDAGNAPGVTGPITITPGQPAFVRLSSSPPWVGGNKHAAITARVVDAFENGVPSQPVVFALLSGTGTLSAMDTTSVADGSARADFLSPRQPEVDRIRASAGILSNQIDLETAFVDPTKGGGYATNYPNPFHPPAEGTTIAYKLDDNATVTMRIFTQSGDLVRRLVFDKSAVGGAAGLNQYVWDGKNGKGDVVASGGYLVLIEAQGTGATLHVIRRKIAVVR
ncbi:MAG TPA: FlgD immunoglobulin-like domain containing protein [Candidatus Limnocylindrales bacterium]|nr:FlgD immunoglobulin-like domain containing protein [Candidatus Limnocylindrales bacterium]